MANIPLKKIRLLVHSDAKLDVLEVIQENASVELTEITDEAVLEKLVVAEKTSFDWNHKSSRLDFAIHFLSQFEKHSGIKAKIRKAIEGTKVFTTKTEVEDIALHGRFEDVIEKAEALEVRLNELDAREKELSGEREIVSSWSNLPFSLDHPRETATMKTFFLRGTAEDSLETDILTIIGTPVYAFYTIDESHHIITFPKEYENDIEKTLSGHDLEIVELPKRSCTVQDFLTQTDTQLSAIHEEREELVHTGEELSTHLATLKKAGDWTYWKKEADEKAQIALGTKMVSIFEGWTVASLIPSLEKNIAEKTSLFTLETIPPSEGEVPPVAISNGSLVYPFESVTRLYGLPGSKDLDPTLFLSGFFFIFFGLCLTDVGYGIILFLLTSLVLFFYRVPKSARPLISLLMYGGLASIIVGLFFGGYFGIDIASLPQWAQDLQVFDPIASPMTVLGLSLAFGVLQIMIGLILKIVSMARNDALLDGILDQGPWLALFVSLLLFGAHATGFLGGDKQHFLWMIYGSLGSIVILSGRKEKSVVKKVFTGVFSLYDSVGYFSDILSYSRLLALGLATTAIAFAVNMIALIVRDLVPVIGPILMILILIGGHIFNLAVNTLGAFIHSARLQFVEFFTKFIGDTGREFKPFHREERNVVLEP